MLGSFKWNYISSDCETMKKLTALFAILMAVSMTMAYAMPSPPVIIPVKLVGDSVTNIPVLIKNTWSGKEVTINSNSNGEVLYDWNNVETAVKGAVFEITAKEEKKTVVFNGDVFDLITFTFGCPTTVVEVIKEVPIEKIVYQDRVVYQDREVIKEVEVPVEKTNWYQFFIAGGVGLLLAFLAVYYQAYRGKMRIQAYEKYRKLNGTYGYHWVTKYSRVDA